MKPKFISRIRETQHGHNRAPSRRTNRHLPQTSLPADVAVRRRRAALRAAVRARCGNATRSEERVPLQENFGRVLRVVLRNAVALAYAEAELRELDRRI